MTFTNRPDESYIIVHWVASDWRNRSSSVWQCFTTATRHSSAHTDRNRGRAISSQTLRLAVPYDSAEPQTVEPQNLRATRHQHERRCCRRRRCYHHIIVIPPPITTTPKNGRRHAERPATLSNHLCTTNTTFRVFEFLPYAIVSCRVGDDAAVTAVSKCRWSLAGRIHIYTHTHTQPP